MSNTNNIAVLLHRIRKKLGLDTNTGKKSDTELKAAMPKPRT